MSIKINPNFRISKTLEKVLIYFFTALVVTLFILQQLPTSVKISGAIAIIAGVINILKHILPEDQLPITTGSKIKKKK